MKKSILATLVALFFFSATALAQPKAGDLTVGGGLSFNTQTGLGNNSSSAFTFNPSGGIFISDNLLIGGRINASTSRAYSEFLDQRTQNTTLGIGPSATYFIGTGPVQPYLGGSITFGTSTSQSSIGGIAGDPTRVGQIGYNLSGGVAYWLASHFAVQAYVSYNADRSKPEGTDASTTAFLNGGVGVRYIWSR